VQVKIVSNYRRPGVGHRPVRARLPADVRARAELQPELRGASESGFLVYAPLQPNEAIEVLLLDDGSFRFSLSSTDPDGESAEVFSVVIGGSAGWGGLGRIVATKDEQANITGREIDQLVGAMSTNVMPGTAAQFGFLGAHNFITPEGWNSLCVSPFNDPRDDGIPCLNCLVETDWYPQNTEFRFAFKRGESIRFRHDTPIGQVVFVPRETVTLAGVPSAAVGVAMGAPAGSA
jgi:uncharacterized protein DUF6065